MSYPGAVDPSCSRGFRAQHRRTGRPGWSQGPDPDWWHGQAHAKASSWKPHTVYPSHHQRWLTVCVLVVHLCKAFLRTGKSQENGSRASRKSIILRLTSLNLFGELRTHSKAGICVSKASWKGVWAGSCGFWYFVLRRKSGRASKQGKRTSLLARTFVSTNLEDSYAIWRHTCDQFQPWMHGYREHS